ncbi:IPT/TIG domain-containing protein [Roseiflexus sp.]|uniref:beta strand repeat-containing protein n=1 Tax=Roseiflexus sp. TaxID=2562120 RepID=UPI0021DD5AF6|nr:IPT/TIG domain-containing protein [Roseiflexus sp.]GIW01933.1 MAG: hypothetical protein KatS3mg058_3336 [Roseiflexus sp.]
MRFISFNLFIRALTIVSFVVGLIGGVGLIPRPTYANVPPSCSTTPLFTNGTFITGTGNGASGANTSSPQGTDTGFGYLVDPTRTQTVPAGPARARLADDFTVIGNGWRPSAITLYAYQINSGTTSTITGVVDLRLWNGVPGDGGAVIAGPVNGTITNNNWTNVYRVPANDLTQTSRPIMAVTINWPFTVTTLLTGTYWIEWGMAGDESLSGPWVPPVSTGTTNNARQLDLSGGEPGTWAPRGDYTNTSNIVEFPFVICGETIPTPQIESLNPNSATAGGNEVTLTVNGSGFIDGTGSDRSVVHWNGSPRATTYISSTQLTASIPASDIATAGTASVTVVNPGNVTSNTETFTINNPAPTITALSPTSAVAGGPGFTLTITGTNFVNGSVVRWNGNDRTTTFVSSTQLTATIPAADIATAGTANVTVVNPAPGGGESGTATFTITNPTPTITSLSPSTTVAGGSGFTLTVAGTNFVNGSVVRWNGNDRTTTFVSGAQLTATIPASDIATAGTASVTVVNPAPGGGESGTATFTITNPTPTITSLSPSTTVAGGSGFTLTITGTNFVNGSVVRWNGSDRTTTFVSSAQLTATIPASDIATAGTASVTVVNPAPGGGESGAATFTIINPTPAISSLSPSTAVAGSSGFTLTITGTNFVNGSVVRWNGNPRTTTFVSGAQLTATIPASDIATAGTASVTVVNPAPGGGESGTATFTITNPTPTITSLSPSTTVAGGSGFTLTITGTNFVNGSVVRWNGSDRTTTFVSGAQLTATILAADIATAGTASVTVVNPAPGGGTSNAAQFTIQASNPTPTISSISPDLIPVGNGDVILTVTGNNFVAGSTVRWNGAPLATTFVSATQVQATLPSAQRSAAGDGSVTVFNSAPGGGVSNAITVPVRFQVMLPLVVR